MNILGIHSGATINQHDPGAAIVRNGELVAACEEERLLRIKSPRGFLPIRSIRYCLEIANIEFKDIDLIIHPGASHEGVADRIVHYLHHYFGTSPEVRLINHQRAHIAGAFYASGFDEAMCMSYDCMAIGLAVQSQSATRMVLKSSTRWRTTILSAHSMAR